MDTLLSYALIFVLLLVLEIVYLRSAYFCDFKERIPRSRSIIRGSGIIFLIGAWVWVFSFSIFSILYPWFLGGLTLVAVYSLIDDGHFLPSWLKGIVRTAAAAMVLFQLGLLDIEWFMENGWLASSLIFAAALVASLAATTVINSMNGINGITAAYSLAVLLPLALVNSTGHDAPGRAILTSDGLFIDHRLIIVTILSALVLACFNLRPKGKSRCYPGDVASIGLAYILVFMMGRLMIATGDLTYLVFLLVYGVDGILSLPRRKRAYLVMAEDLGLNHVVISVAYMLLQMLISWGFIYKCPNTLSAHCIYLAATALLLATAHTLFMKKYYTAK